MFRDVKGEPGDRAGRWNPAVPSLDEVVLMSEAPQLQDGIHREFGKAGVRLLSSAAILLFDQDHVGFDAGVSDRGASATAAGNTFHKFTARPIEFGSLAHDLILLYIFVHFDGVVE